MIIFDCDGVLVDSETINIDSELAFLAREGLEFERAEYQSRFSGTNHADFFAAMRELFLSRLGRPMPEGFPHELGAYVMEQCERHLKPVPGITELLAGLEGRALCVASSTPAEWLERKLGITGLERFFGLHLFSGEMVERGKPAPDIFLLAGRAMGETPEKCLVVEDSVNGIRAARAAGMTALGLCAGGHCPSSHGDVLSAAGAHHVFGSAAELAGFLRSA